MATITHDGSDLPIRNNPDLASFDIVAAYHKFLAEDPELTMPVAAIEALIEALSRSSAKTVFETMDLIKTQSAKLQGGVRNPIALTHGTELFQQYLLLSLKQPAPDGKETSAHANFEVVRQHLMSNGRLFADRARQARELIASAGRPYVRDGEAVLTHGASRVVRTLLVRAAELAPGDRRRNFRVVLVVGDAPGAAAECNRVIVAPLRAKGIPVATVPESAAAYAMSKLHLIKMVIVGAEAVSACGGVVSCMGTYQLALLAKQLNKPFFVATEQHKFGKTFPLNSFDLGFEQGMLDFRVSPSKAGVDGRLGALPRIADPVDYTPPDLITAFLTDNGVMTPSAVAKQIIEQMY
ncbi:nagb/rpia/CoA transferase-like protein [Hypoxylon sp. FL1284]|nr:nagb/rpia/CoA transferase-like protein [Hypoxylon sp. FL1284]